MTYDYDNAGNMLAVRENGTGVLAQYGYDDLGRRTSLTRGNGTLTSFSYDAASRLQALAQDLAGSARDLNLGFAYNSAGQIRSTTRDNGAYAWTGAVNVDRAYAVNGLNQLTQSGSVALGYDARGNLTSSGATAYTYDIENRMTAAGGASLSYDPLGRLFYTSGAGGL